MNKRFAIFDMDGTLIDSMPYWQRLGREYLTRKGVTEDLSAILERIKPMTMAESSALFHRELGIPGTPQQIADEMNAIMEAHYRLDIGLKPGAAEYVRRLKDAGVRMCVASATAAHLMSACLCRLGIADCFSFLLSCEEVRAGKDRPDVFFAAAARLGAEPREIAAYEDALHAAETAARAGFYTIGVYDASGKDNWAQLQRLADESIRDWHDAAQQLDLSTKPTA